jgi:surface polysaccharide O-acyltransferase-like enzyme
VLKRSGMSRARPVGGTTRRLTATPASGKIDRRPTAAGIGGEAAEEQPLERRGELDLLRALVVVGLVFFHTGVIFGAGEFPVKAATENHVATVVLAFGATWGMPLLFLVSGMGIWYSLRARSPTSFARERLRRLGVPLVIGLLILVPLQVYLGQRCAGDTSSYADFYARFWKVRPALDFPFVLTAAPDGAFETGHLWFLVCLLAFSVVLLPSFTFLRAPQGTWQVDWLAGLLVRPVGFLLPALPLVAVEVALGSEVGHGGWNQGSYALFLLYGFLAVGGDRVGEAFQRQWRPAVALGLLLFVAAGAVYAAAGERGDPFTGMDPFSIAFRLLKSVDGWLWVVAILGLAGSRIASSRQSPAQTAADQLDRPNVVARLRAYANEAVLPFYVLHETIIVILAYFMLGWPIGAAAQYCLIASTSLVATGLVYDLGVRRTTVMRFLFGLKPAPQTEPDQASST